MSEEVLISVKEAARRLSISPWMAYQLCRQDELKTSYIGRRCMVWPDSVVAYAKRLPTEAPAKSEPESA